MDQNAGMIILKSSDDLIIWDWDSTVSFKGMNMGITGMIGESDTGTTTGRDLPRKKKHRTVLYYPLFSSYVRYVHRNLDNVNPGLRNHSLLTFGGTPKEVII